MHVQASALRHLRIPALALLGTAVVLPVCVFMQTSNSAVQGTPTPLELIRIELSETPTPIQTLPTRNTGGWKDMSEAIHASKNEVEDAMARIQTEVSTLKKQTTFPIGHWSHSFAGTYGYASSPSPWSSFTIAPTAGIAFMRGGCFGLEDCNSGSIVDTFDSDQDQQIDGVIVSWKHQSWNRDPFILEKFYFVLWPGTYGIADLKYLVSESDMPRLVDDVNRGGWHRNLIAYELMTEPDQVQLSESGSFKSVRAGFPKLPAQWDAMLLKTPLLATITALGPDGSLTFDKGRLDNVFIGMKFNLTSDHTTGTINIVGLEDHSARGTFISSPNSPSPTVGLKVFLTVGDD